MTEGATVCRCEYCGNTQTLPKTRDVNIANLFNRANDLRLNYDFDKAEAIYEKIVESDPTEAEAYWGMVLCQFGVEYVKDPASGARIPTCHRTQNESIQADVNYKAAIRYADPSQRSIYEAEALKIDNIQKDILSIVYKEEPYDVFICYKETDESGNRTEDSIIAGDIYHQLEHEGFKVFYSAITLQGKFGEYEPYIFAALNSAKVMIVIGTKPEYFQAVWVKNEWSRFLELMKNDRSKRLIPCYKNMTANELPVELSRLQALDMSPVSFLTNLTTGIKDYVKPRSAQESVNKNPPPAEPTPVPVSQSAPPSRTYESSYSSKPQRSSYEKKSGGCFSVIMKIFIFIFIIIALICIFGKSLTGSSKKPAENTTSVEITEVTEPEPVFGEEVIELHEILPTEVCRVTESASYGYVLNNVLWDGAFVYRAGNGDSFAYTIYQIDGLFEKISFRATPLLGHEDFFKSTTVDIMLINNETNDIVYSKTIDYYSEDVEIEADISGINSLKIYVNKTSSGLGDLGYTLIKDAYLYPVGYSEDASQEETESAPAAYIVNGNIRTDAGTDFDLIQSADPTKEYASTGNSKTGTDGDTWYEIYLDDEKTQTGWVHSSIAEPV